MLLDVVHMKPLSAQLAPTDSQVTLLAHDPAVFAIAWVAERELWHGTEPKQGAHVLNIPDSVCHTQW